MSTVYLKDIVGMTPDGILSARIASIGPVELNKNQKQYRKVKFLFPSTGKTHEEGVFEFNFKGSLSGANVGDTVEITLDNGWPAYRLLKADAENPTPARQTNYAQVKSERVATDALNEAEKKREREQVGKCIFGYMNTEMAKGLTPAEAKAVALDAYRLMEQAVTEILSVVPPVPEPSVKEADLPF